MDSTHPFAVQDVSAAMWPEPLHILPELLASQHPQLSLRQKESLLRYWVSALSYLAPVL